MRYINSKLREDAREYVKKYGEVKTGSAAITSGKFGWLKCKYIIHAVGPSVHGELKQKDIDNLKTAIEKVYDLAEENKVKSVSIPAVSSGIFGFPKKKCAEIMIEVTIDHLDKMKDKTSIKEIRFTNIDIETCRIFENELKILI